MSVRRVRWHGYGLSAANGDYGSNSGNYMYGGDGGYQDTPPDWVETYSNLQSRAWMQSSYWSGKGFGSSIGMAHFAAAVVPGGNNCWAGWSVPTTSSWSFRLYIQWDLNLVARGFNGAVEIVELLSGWSGGKSGTKRWGWGATSELYSFPYDQGGQGALTAPGATTVRTGLVSIPTSSPVYPGFQFGGKQVSGSTFNSPPSARYGRHRIEGKCSGGTLTVNIYEAPQTAVETSVKSIRSIVLPSSSMDYFVIGAKTDLTTLRPVINFSSIEFWDDTSSPDDWPRGPYVRPKLSIESVISVDPTVSTPVSAVEQKHLSTGFVSTLDLSTINYYGERRESNYNTEFADSYYKNIPYTSNASPSLDVYIPDESVFPGPHPIVTWVHGGFFSAGGKATIDKGWVKSLTGSGYAVIAPSYPLVPIQLTDGGANAHPIQIRYIKKFLKFISDPSFTTEWNLDASKLVASGHSAGGFLSQSAAHSANIGTINGYNLNGSASFSTMGPDVIVDGVYTYSAPVSWTRVITENASLSVGTTTTRSYMGLGLNTATADSSYKADLTDFITAASQPIPTAYAYGTSDTLVTPQHGTVDLQIHLSQLSPPRTCDLYAVNAAHDNIMELNNPVEDTSVKGIVTWMNDLHGI